MLIFVKLWILKKYARRLLRASIQGLTCACRYSGRSSVIFVLTRIISQDSVALSFAVDGRVIDLMIPRNYAIPFPEGRTCNYIPMETYLDQAMDVNDEIPIFAVTGGICGAMDFMGTPMFTQDYCGLRDKHLHPKEWVNIDDVHNYCFYTIEFH